LHLLYTQFLKEQFYQNKKAPICSKFRNKLRTFLIVLLVE